MNMILVVFISLSKVRCGAVTAPGIATSSDRGHSNGGCGYVKTGALCMSIFEDDSADKCYLCGKWGKCDEHHVFSGPCRKTSDRYGFVVHLCRKCHSLIHDSARGSDLKLYLHQRGQIIYEERIGSREEFIRDFIRSYL